MYLFHNTADAALTDPRSSGLDIKSPGSWTMITARNNIWSGTDFAISNANPSQPLDLDYDDLYTTRAGELAWWSGLSARHLNTLSELQTATGQELHGTSVLPGFAGAAGGDYTLSGTSALIDAGVAIPGINDDFVGLAPDIGAYEYQGFGFSLDATPVSQAIRPGSVATYDLSLGRLGGFSDTVHFSASEPGPGLVVNLDPEQLMPPGMAMLTVTDTHTTSPVPGLWHMLSITATGGGLAERVDVYLLVGGARLYLPLALRAGA
jgi:hypothetical protein